MLGYPSQLHLWLVEFDDCMQHRPAPASLPKQACTNLLWHQDQCHSHYVKYRFARTAAVLMKQPACYWQLMTQLQCLVRNRTMLHKTAYYKAMTSGGVLYRHKVGKLQEI